MRSFATALVKIFLTILITLIILICIKSNSKFKTSFYKHVYDTSFSFARINTLYQSYFGSPLPFQEYIDVKPVFNEQLEYNSREKYLDGISLSVSNDYLVPVLKGGLVVFTGVKEGYGNVVIIQQVDGIDVWYGNLDTINVKLYDYMESGSLLGSVQKQLYLVYKKDGNVLNYEEYIP